MLGVIVLILIIAFPFTLDFLFSAHSLIIVYILPGFDKNILSDFRVMERKRFQYLLLQRSIIP